MPDHSFRMTLRQVNMTDAEKVALAAISRLTITSCRSNTPEQVWDMLLEEADSFLSAGSLPTLWRHYSENLLREFSRKLEEMGRTLSDQIKDVKDTMATKTAQQRLSEAQANEASEVSSIKTVLTTLKTDSATKFTELEGIIADLRNAAGSGDSDVINAAADKAEAVVNDLKDMHSGLDDLDSSVKTQSGAPAPTPLSITPTSVTVAAGGQTTFSTNVPSTFSAQSGSVDANGVYTAPTDPTITSDVVTATSQTDTTQTATATVTLTAVQVPSV